MPKAGRFNLAFKEWMRSNPSVVDQMGNITNDAAGRLDISLRRFAPFLSVHLSKSGVSVAAEWNGEVWDLLFDIDLVAVKTRSGKWRCKLCPKPRVKFASIEDLWLDHLFAPLADWITGTLMPARALFLCEIEGTTWATLTDGAEIPPGARYGAFEQFDDRGECTSSERTADLG